MIPRKLLDEIHRWVREKKYGNLQINFVGGKIVNVNRTESLRVEMLVANTPDIKMEASLIQSLDTKE